MNTRNAGRTARRYRLATGLFAAGLLAMVGGCGDGEGGPPPSATQRSATAAEDGVDGPSCVNWGAPGTPLTLGQGSFFDVEGVNPVLLFPTPPSDIKLVLKGQFPMLRFLSLQSNVFDWDSSRNPPLYFRNVSTLLDRDVVMDPDSTNPYIVGNPINASPRQYTVEYLPPGATSAAPNKIWMDNGLFGMQHLEMRYYSPDAGVNLTTDDLPAVYARYVSTGAPAPCPWFPSMSGGPEPCTTGHVPQTSGPRISFSVWMNNQGAYNTAVPGYVGSTDTAMAPGQVAVVRFKAPTFANTYPGVGTYPSGKDVRYWSVSINDLSAGWATKGGVADHGAKINDSGYVTLVVGPQSVAATAQARGHTFVLDQRCSTATSILFTLRNVLPSLAFWPISPDTGTRTAATYPAAYIPTGLVCDAGAYLWGFCNP